MRYVISYEIIPERRSLRGIGLQSFLQFRITGSAFQMLLRSQGRLVFRYLLRQLVSIIARQ